MIAREPLTIAEMKKIVDEDNFGSVQVLVELDDMIDNDLEAFLDILVERIGAPLLMNVEYKVVGVEDEYTVVMKVTGDFSEVFEEEEEDDEN